MEQQKKRICEQDKIISHLTSRLSRGSSPTSLEELECLALARFPKVQGQDQGLPGASFQGVQQVPGATLQEVQEVRLQEEVGDSDSAIQLDFSYSSDSDSVTIRQSTSQRSSEIPRMMRNRFRRQKTTIVINPRD